MSGALDLLRYGRNFCRFSPPVCPPNNGKSGLKHPNNTDAYSGGHLDGCLPFGLKASRSDYDDLDSDAEEAMLRTMFEGIDEPGFLEELFA
ncbi:hypothetical protein E2562_016181 [Oryza meyeriana var. granulata]|uniref:Uncharacterized protein n=1 Tax=Oryza meyeriana var. granulata TaxID=110450 RepID=A0A6G1CQF4_9ORYZ|nr:hypothetical protein E2562_016181 [Oryza meyeriana var. granulata]